MRNPWNNRTAVFAVLVAFVAGVIIALAFREGNNTSTGIVDSSEQLAPIHWRVPVAFGTNLPALGDNILIVAEMIEKATNKRIKFELFEHV